VEKPEKEIEIEEESKDKDSVNEIQPSEKIS